MKLRNIFKQKVWKEKSILQLYISQSQIPLKYKVYKKVKETDCHESKSINFQSLTKLENSNIQPQQYLYNQVY